MAFDIKSKIRVSFLSQDYQAKLRFISVPPLSPIECGSQMAMGEKSNTQSSPMAQFVAFGAGQNRGQKGGIVASLHDTSTRCLSSFESHLAFRRLCSSVVVLKPSCPRFLSVNILPSSLGACWLLIILRGLIFISDLPGTTRPFLSLQNSVCVVFLKHLQCVQYFHYRVAESTRRLDTRSELCDRLRSIIHSPAPHIGKS